MAKDSIARALASGAGAAAAGAAAQGVILDRKSRFRANLASASIVNASDAPPMSNPPTVVMSSSAGVTATGTLQKRVTTDPQLFTMYGGVPVVYSSSFWRGYSVTVPSGGNITSTQNGIAQRVAFRTDEPVLDIVLLGVPATLKYRLLIDGIYVDKTGYSTVATSGFQYLQITNTSRKMRRYDVEMEGPCGFAGVNISASGTIRPVDTTKRYRIGAYCNSIGAAVGAIRANDGFAYHAGRRLGNMDVEIFSMSLGGTDFLNPGSTWKYMDHINDLLLIPLDELWIVPGTNDVGYAGYTDAAEAAAALAFFRAARTLLPNVPIIVGGVFVPSGNLAGAQQVEAAIKAGFDAWADPNSAYIPFANASPSLQTGAAYGQCVASVSAGSTSLVVTSGNTIDPAAARYVLHPNLPVGTKIVGGTTGTSGTFTLSQAASADIAAGTAIGLSASTSGNYGLWGGGNTGVDVTHPCSFGHDMIGDYWAMRRRNLPL